MKKLFVFLSLFCLCLSVSVGAYTIVKPENAEVWEESAVQELDNALKASLQKGIFIAGQAPEFHVGATDFVKRENLNLSEEEWLIRSVGNKVLLYGGGTRGTFYAVSIFLERFIGMRRFNMSEEYIPKHDAALNLTELELRGKPEFIFRSIYPDYRTKRDDGRYAIFNRMNAYGPVKISSAYGGAVAYGSPDHVHTFNKYISEKEFFAEHPEYFSLQGGKRNPHYLKGQLCLSHPDLPGIFWEKLQQYILADEKKAAEQGVPAPYIYDISHNDNNSFCSCNSCTEIRKKHGDAEAGLQLLLLNKLAKQLKVFRPKLKISTLAYFQTEKLPTGIELEDNILIRLCNTSNNYAAGISSYGEEPYRERIKNWGSLAAALGTWDYGVTFNRRGKGLPYPSEFFLQETIQYYRDNKVMYLFTEREHVQRSDMNTLKGWLHAKLMENPDANFQALFDDFMNLYYGQAGKYIAQYRKTLLESVKKQQPYIVAFMPPAAAFTHLDYETVSTCDKLLQEAEEAVADNPLLLRRVREARASIDEAIVIFIRKFNLDNPNHGLNVELARNRLYDTVKNSIEFHLIESAHKSHLKMEKGFLEVYEMLPENIPAIELSAEGIDIPIDIAAWWAGRRDLVLDEESALGYAVKVPQASLAMACGAYDQQTRTTYWGAAVRTRDVKSAGYNWYTLPAIKPMPAAYMYLTNDWHVQFPLSIAAMKNRQNPDRKWIVKASIRFAGPGFPFGKENDENAIYIDRIIMEPGGNRE